ncbi:hypothetical protein [Nesterenkonia halotolerans]|uniref:DUF4383 domain-containing protein n=1 Tax=Nesterenkonia halotolerans TaxID=225325 RepID=A0ABR9J706_9MICC|nr:hypothetical protein [Nesterenkonia halotolerans]MBE1514773.1 hypothetical protein [Nesterenkonia halotolerans]
MPAEVTTSRRRATGRTLLIVSALGTAGFAGWSMAQLQQSGPETFLAEAWHAFGLVVFAGLFALVAWRPRAYPGLMELTILHSAGMFVLAFSNQDAAGSTANMVLHGLLTLALLIAYVMLGCIKAWGRQSAPAPRKDTSKNHNAAKDSGKKPVGEAEQRKGLDRDPASPAPASAPASAPRQESAPAGQAQPTKPMPQSLPEDRPRS